MTTLYKNNLKLSCENEDLTYFLKMDFAEVPQDIETFKSAEMLAIMFWNKDGKAIKTLVDEAGVEMFEKMGAVHDPKEIKPEPKKTSRKVKDED